MFNQQFRDPAGEEYEREHLRKLGKWRFAIVRGALGVGWPFFLWIAVSDIRKDIEAAHLLQQPVSTYLFRSWLAMFAMCAALGCFVGLLAWRRLASDYWPGQQPDPDSTHTRIGLS